MSTRRPCKPCSTRFPVIHPIIFKYGPLLVQLIAMNAKACSGVWRGRAYDAPNVVSSVMRSVENCSMPIVFSVSAIFLNADDE